MSQELHKKSRWLDAITHLIALTQQGKLKWRHASQSEMPRHDESESAVLISEFNNRKLRLYLRRIETPPPPETMIRLQPLPRWSRMTVLEFIDDNGGSLWSFPSIVGLGDLLEVAQYQVSGVRDFLAEIEALAS